MKKTIFKAISVFLCVLMALSAVTAMAAEETETYFGASSDIAYGTDIEYMLWAEKDFILQRTASTGMHIQTPSATSGIIRSITEWRTAVQRMTES